MWYKVVYNNIFNYIQRLAELILILQTNTHLPDRKSSPKAYNNMPKGINNEHGYPPDNETLSDHKGQTLHCHEHKPEHDNRSATVGSYRPKHRERNSHRGCLAIPSGQCRRRGRHHYNIRIRMQANSCDLAFSSPKLNPSCW